MAKARFAKDLRTGSTKTETYSTLATQKEGRVQIIKDRVYKITNPQSSGQMMTRIAFATANIAAKVMAEIVGISFEGVTNHVFAKQLFKSLNISELIRLGNKRGRWASFSPKGNTYLIPNSYIMSKGSLSLPEWAQVQTMGTEKGGSFENNAWASLTLNKEIAFGTYTAEQLWQIIFGLQPGDQITFPQINCTDEVGVSKTIEDAQGNIEWEDYVRVSSFAAPRIVLLEEMPAETLTISSSTTYADIVQFMSAAVNTAKSYSPAVTAFFELFTSSATTNVAISPSTETWQNMSVESDMTLIGLCVIISRKKSDGWKYTTSKMVCVYEDLDVAGPTESFYFGWGAWAAMNSYQKTKKTTDSNFLQTATDKKVLPEDFQ